MIHDLGHNGADSVHDMHILNTDVKYQLTKTPEKCLQEAEKAKKKMYMEACLQQCCYLLNLVASIDGSLGVEAGDILKRLASRLEKSGGNPTPGRADTSRVGFPSISCRIHTGASGVQGAGTLNQRAGPCSGRTAPE